MTATVTADELVAAALQRLDLALERLDLPLTVVRVHALRQDLTVVRLTLLTEPLRPEEVAANAG